MRRGGLTRREVQFSDRMLVTFGYKKTVFLSWTMTTTMKFLVLLLSVLARVNGQWEYDDNYSAASLSEGQRCQIKTGEAGICRKLTSCEVYYEGLRQKTIKYSFLVRCSFIDTEEVICCPNTDTPNISQPTSDETSQGRNPIVATGSSTMKTSITTARSTTTSTTTSSTSTTTIRPIVFGGKPITGNGQFIDLSKLSKTTTTKRPRQNRLELREPTINNNNNLQPIQQNQLTTPIQTPVWMSTKPSQRVPQVEERPVNQQNIVRFPTEPTRWQSPITVVPVNPDVEVFNTIDNNSGTTGKLIKFPGPMALPQPFPTISVPPKTENVVIAQANNAFDQFKFRPASGDSNVGNNNGMNLVDGSNLITQMPVRTITTTTERIITNSATTTEAAILTDWMLDALNQVSSSTSTMRPTLPQSPMRAPPMIATSFTMTTEATNLQPVDLVTTRTNRAERPSQAACQRYTALNPAGLTFHILDGVPVTPGEFPHIGGLIFPQGGGNDVDNRCGSSLISERYVLTAAHCVNDPLALPTFVRFGVVIWNSKDEDYPPLDAEIETITLHPEYRSHLRYHDIALIKLRNDVQFTSYIRPACLNSDLRDIDSDTPLVVIGWGVTNVQTRARSEILLKTNVTTVALQDCNATHIAYGTSRAYRSGLNEGHYCAFDPELKKDACQSDSGGPLNLVRSNQSTIIGIVSFGLSCGSAVPSVYVRVAYYLDWIESIVWPS